MKLSKELVRWLIQIKERNMHRAKEVDLRMVGLAQRIAIWGFLAVVAANLLQIFVKISFLQIIAIPFLIYGVFRLARSLGLHIVETIVYCVLLVIPIIGILALWNLINKATKILHAKGIKVGVMGPIVEDLPVNKVQS